MPISLIRSTKNDIIHGSDNDRRTGCGIRFQGVTGFAKTGEMKEITDMTCEKCKEIFAIKLIRESNREEQRIEKEERKKFARAKKQGIVTEKTFEEYRANREFEASSKREAKKGAQSELPPLKADMPQYIPGQGIAPHKPVSSAENAPNVEPDVSKDDSTPSYEEYISAAGSFNNQKAADSNPASGSANISNDDFLNQFMVKPVHDNDTAEKPVSDTAQTAENIISAASGILPTIQNEFDDSFINNDIKNSADNPYNSFKASDGSSDGNEKIPEGISYEEYAQQIQNENSKTVNEQAEMDQLFNQLNNSSKALLNRKAEQTADKIMSTIPEVGDIISSIDKYDDNDLPLSDKPGDAAQSFNEYGNRIFDPSFSTLNTNSEHSDTNLSSDIESVSEISNDYSSEKPSEDDIFESISLSSQSHALPVNNIANENNSEAMSAVPDFDLLSGVDLPEINQPSDSQSLSSQTSSDFDTSIQNDSETRQPGLSAVPLAEGFETAVPVQNHTTGLQQEYGNSFHTSQYTGSGMPNGFDTPVTAPQYTSTGMPNGFDTPVTAPQYTSTGMPNGFDTPVTAPQYTSTGMPNGFDTPVTAPQYTSAGMPNTADTSIHLSGSYYNSQISPDYMNRQMPDQQMPYNTYQQHNTPVNAVPAANNDLNNLISQNQFGQQQFNNNQNMFGTANNYNAGFGQNQQSVYPDFQNNINQPSYNSANVFNNDTAGQVQFQSKFNFDEQQFEKNEVKKPPVSPVFDKSDNIKSKPAAFFNGMTQSVMVDSIEDALRQLGSADDSDSQKKKENAKDEVIPEFVAYVPSSSKTLYNDPPPANLTSNAPKKQLSARDAKKLAKIDAKFHKHLAEQGYNIPEYKNQRRGK